MQAADRLFLNNSFFAVVQLFSVPKGITGKGNVTGKVPSRLQGGIVPVDWHSHKLTRLTEEED